MEASWGDPAYHWRGFGKPGDEDFVVVLTRRYVPDEEDEDEDEDEDEGADSTDTEEESDDEGSAKIDSAAAQVSALPAEKND